MSLFTLACLFVCFKWTTISLSVVVFNVFLFVCLFLLLFFNGVTTRKIKGSNRAGKLVGKQEAGVLEDLKCWGAWVTTGMHKAKDNGTTWTAWRRERHTRSKRSMILLERATKGYRQPNWHCNHVKGNTKETSGRRGVAHMGPPERTDTILTRRRKDD